MPDPLFDFSDDEEESPVELFSGLDFKLVKSPSPDEDDRKKYTKLVRSTAEEYGIPKNFAVAQVHVESRYKPKAKSKANAAGLFQFIKSTGRASGLKISGKIDERYVPEKAAKAYGRHIQKLKSDFKKQFPKLKDDELYFLVLGGYNWSPGKTARFARRRLAGKDAKLPTETQAYIDKIFGMTTACSSLSRQGCFSEVRRKQQPQHHLEKTRLILEMTTCSGTRVFSRRRKSF